MHTSKSCVFCLDPFFPHLTVSCSLPVARIILLKRCYACNTLWGSGGESVLRFRLVALQTCYVVWSLKCLERIKSALQRKRSGILLSPATNLLSVRFHIVDKYLHSLIIQTSFQIPRGFFYPIETLNDSLSHLKCFLGHAMYGTSVF